MPRQNEVIETEGMESLPAIYESAAPEARIGEPVGLLTREVVDRMKEQIALLKELKLEVLRSTMAGDWYDFSGKPYPTDPAIQAIAGTIGMTFGKPEILRNERKDAKGDLVEFVCDLSATWRGKVYSDIGVASTRDPFFARAKSRDVPFEDIDQGDVRKKAITNAQHRILVKALGIGGVTWEELGRLGVTRGAGGAARFAGSERKMATGSGAWTPEKEKLWGYLLEIYQGDEEAAKSWLFKKTDNPSKGFAGVRDAQQLSIGQVKWILPIVEAELEKRQGEEMEDRAPGEEG